MSGFFIYLIYLYFFMDTEDVPSSDGKTTTYLYSFLSETKNCFSPFNHPWCRFLVHISEWQARMIILLSGAQILVGLFGEAC